MGRGSPETDARRQWEGFTDPSVAVDMGPWAGDIGQALFPCGWIRPFRAQL